MTQIRQVKTTFTAGDTAAGAGRLIAFEFNTEQTYLLVLTDGQMDIYADGVHIESLSAPWAESQIQNIAWTQSADTMLIVHPGTPPKRLLRNADGSFSLGDWLFFTGDDDVVCQPYYKFTDTGMTLTPSATTGTVTLTASADVFTEDHEGTRLRIGGREVEITDFSSATVVTADVIETLAGTGATVDWQEQAFSAVRGYPATVAFHQGRLVIGGSRDLPNRLWLSKSGDLFNFDLGTGLDDESIEFGILSDQVNAIRGLFSGRHLQVFTSGAEWMVTGDPLTPATVQLNRQTRVGSLVERHIPPVSVDGATLFIARNRQEIREFIYTDLEQAYQATDLALLSRHLIDGPVDQDYDATRRLLFLVREDGKFATLTVYRAEAVAAWTLHETSGAVLSVAVVGNDVYMLVDRNGDAFIELLDDNLCLDAGLNGESETPASTWSGLDHLEGRMVTILADGFIHASQEVLDGQVTLDEPAATVTIGLPYTHIVEPLPPSAVAEGGAGRAVRLVEGIFRLHETAALRLDIGRGLRDIPLRQIGGEEDPGTPPPVVSEDIRVRAFGWHPGRVDPALAHRTINTAAVYIAVGDYGTQSQQLRRSIMGALSAGGLVGSLSTAATVLKTLDSTFSAVQNFSGGSDNDQRAALRAQQDLALKQLQQRQNLDELSAAERDALERRNIAANAAAADNERRMALKRAVARQRAQFGAQGLSGDEGSGEAVLLGLFDESDQDKIEREQLDNRRFQALEQDENDRRRINVLQRTQLKEKQNLESLLNGY